MEKNGKDRAIYSLTAGILLIAGYAAVMFALTWIFARGFGRNKTLFLAAGRTLGQWEGAFSIAATWIWAPALFIASQKAYTQGLAGVFWFTVPNILCLVIFAWFADLMRRKTPEGFTLSDYMRARFSSRVHNLYLIEMTGLAACSFAVQLLAGGAVISSLTSIPFLWVTISMALIALAYSLFSGLKASVVTDFVQMAFILAVGFTLVPWAVYRGGGLEAVARGLGGVSGTYGSLFSGDGASVFYSFGIVVTIGLLSGPFGDQSFWQRAFGLKKHAVKRAFIMGALIFGLVPILMSFLGFLAAGNKLAVGDVQLTNLEAIKAYLPAWTMAPFVYMLLSGLISTLDSNLSAISAIGGHDILNRLRKDGPPPDSEVVAGARLNMLLLAAAGLLIANLPGIKILYLFLFYGTLRASTLLPTVLTLLKDEVPEAPVFWGILLAMVVGLPLFAYGNLTGSLTWILFGSLFTVLFPGLTVAAGLLSAKPVMKES